MNKEHGTPIAIKNPPLPHFARMIRKLRTESGMTQKELAKAAEISESALRSYELANRTPKYEVLNRIALALKVKPEVLSAPDFTNIFELAYALAENAETLGYVIIKREGCPILVPITETTNNAFFAILQERDDIRPATKNGNSSIRRRALTYPANLNYVKKPDSGWTHPDRQAFAAKLKWLRKLDAHMTQEELASISGVDVLLIQNYEQEKSLAKEDVIEKLALSLKVSPATFKACSLDNIILLDEDAQIRLVKQLFFQISNVYDLEPYVEEEVVGLRGNGRYIEHALDNWMERIEANERAIYAALQTKMESEEYCTAQNKIIETTKELERFTIGYDEPYNPKDNPSCTPSIKDTLRRLRKARGLTQQNLAEKAGISMFSIRSYEQGKRIPMNHQRIALADALEVPVEVLTDFNITNPNEAFHYLLELARIFNMRPKHHRDIILLAPMDHEGLIGKFIRNWNKEMTKVAELFADSENGLRVC